MDSAALSSWGWTWSWHYIQSMEGLVKPSVLALFRDTIDRDASYASQDSWLQISRWKHDRWIQTRAFYCLHYNCFTRLQQDCQRPKQSLSNRAESQSSQRTHTLHWLEYSLTPCCVLIHTCITTCLVHAQQQCHLSVSPLLGSRASFWPQLTEHCWCELGEDVTESHREW